MGQLPPPSPYYNLIEKKLVPVTKRAFVVGMHTMLELALNYPRKKQYLSYTIISWILSKRNKYVSNRNIRDKKE